MEKNYTLWQRITANTPSFFKKVQLLGLAVAALGTSLAQIQGISSELTTTLISAGSAMAIIAQFAVKQYEPDNTTSSATK